MKSIAKILSRYVLSAAGVALILLLLNLTAFYAWMMKNADDTSGQGRVSAIAQALKEKDGAYSLTPEGEKMIDGRFAWAMLLDGEGNAVWSRNLPGDVKRKYTVAEAASFSRWYLNGYPVSVWRYSQGLLVLGAPKGSLWKYQVQFPEKVLRSAPAWLTGTLIANCAAAVILALLFGLRLIRSLKPLAQGIEDMARKQPVFLPPGGLLGDLAEKLNDTSRLLQEQEAFLQKRDTVRTHWIAGVSHDIRTPLSVVMGYASHLEESPALPEPEREKARVIRRQSERIRALINDLNLASKLEYDMQPLRRSKFRPAELVRAAAADFLNRGLDVSRYPIEVTVKEGAQELVLNGDRELVQRAVSNLIQNSIRHNPDGCAVTVCVEPLYSCCKISVRDSGSGFPQKVLRAISAPITPEPLDSHGLGLTIVRGIARAHGGKAEFRNLPQGGGEASLLLPCPVPEQESKGPICRDNRGRTNPSSRP
jgi:signal transduction histidine kinase